jgi:cell filamentation protein
MNQQKISIRFFNDREVRAVWDEENSKWRFSVLDIVSVLTDQDDYTKTRNYWKYLKAKLKKENSELVSLTTQLKLQAADGKRYKTDMLDQKGIVGLGKEFPGKKANRFIEWFTYSDESIDGKSKSKAYALYESSFIESIEVGTTKGTIYSTFYPHPSIRPLKRATQGTANSPVFSSLCFYLKHAPKASEREDKV